ncbi:hypothetical protein VTN77DRAFT_5888 [Rasamsonia byssochlamydoides]|uniref:uncharacterized protein n=1 Tax=Rasamsonia byssochlamydoides TaxID=89139 RepID=UPI003743AABF
MNIEAAWNRVWNNPDGPEGTFHIWLPWTGVMISQPPKFWEGKIAAQRSQAFVNIRTPTPCLGDDKTVAQVGVPLTGFIIAEIEYVITPMILKGITSGSAFVSEMRRLTRSEIVPSIDPCLCVGRTP